MSRKMPADCTLSAESIVEFGEHLGYQWVIAKAPTYGLNGYIRIPEHQTNHPWEDEEQILDTNEHPWGEVTYKRGRWQGFDNCHPWNHWDEEYVWVKTPVLLKVARNDYGGEPKRWDTLNTTRQQVRHMIEQAHEAYNQQTITGTYTI